MSRQSPRGDRPEPRPNPFNPSDGARLPDCSQSSGWNSEAQLNEDYHSLLPYIKGNLLELWRSSRDTADQAYRKLQPVVSRECPDLLSALQRIYCSRKNQ